MPKFLNANNSISSSEFSSTYSNDIIIISKDVIFQVHDKTFKEILKNSIEMTKFLKSFIGLEVNSENLKICNSNFITNDYKRRESDILYKNINKNIFYLVEHLSTINVDMPRRILEYSTEIMREIKKNKLELLFIQETKIGMFQLISQIHRLLIQITKNLLSNNFIN